MNVLFLSGLYPTNYDPTRGVFVHEQAKKLAEQGCNIKVVSPIPYTPPLLNRMVGKWNALSNVPHRQIWENMEAYYPRYIGFPRKLFFEYSGDLIFCSIRNFVRKICEVFEFELIHAHTAMPHGYAALKLGELFGKPVVCTLHGSDVMVYPEINSSVKRKTIKTLTQVDRLIAVSTALKRQSEELVGKDLPITVAHNGVDEKIFKLIDRENARKILGLPLDYRIVLYVGHLLPVKGLEYLVEAVHKIQSKYKLLTILVGEGPLRNRLRKRISRLDLQNKVRLVGRKPHNALYLYMNAADVLVLPSLSEGWPTVIFESFACGLPVIGSRVGGIPEAVKSENHGILFESRDVQGLMNTLESALKKEWDRKRLRKYALKNSWNAVGKKIIKVYRTCAP
jgi:teichuronic acid biosynthesis glycosyltransferase TuaC